METSAKDRMTSRNFKLGTDDMGRLRELCGAWGVSQSEAVRRSIGVAHQELGTLRDPSVEYGDRPCEEMEERVTCVCHDVSLLAQRVGALEARAFGLEDGVVYGVVSLEEDSGSGMKKPGRKKGKKKKKKGSL